MIDVLCKCGRRFGVPDEQAGTLTKCPDCEGMIFVPSPQADEDVRLDGADDAAGEATGALVSDEMLALQEGRRAALAGAPGAGKPPEAGPGPAVQPESQPPLETRETEVAAPAGDSVVAGPAQSDVDGQGFAVDLEDRVLVERRQFERCPQCETPLERGATVCTACGYNVVTGERLRRVKVMAAEPDAAEVSLGVLAYVATWIVKLRYAVIAGAVLAALAIGIIHWVAERREEQTYRAEVSGGGVVGWWDQAQKAVEQEAFDLERRTREKVQLAMVKLNAEPEAEKGVFCRESTIAAQDAYIEARNVRVMEDDPARAERLLLAIDTLYGPMDPWGARARSELARLRRAATQSAPASRPE